MKQQKHVLILGAGASAASDFHLPTMAGFFNYNISDYPVLKDFLEWFYPNKSIQDYNLEEVLSYLDISKARHQFWGFQYIEGFNGKASSVYDETIKFIKERLMTEKDKVCSVHHRLFEILDPKDTIITLNYDLIADRTLTDIEKDPKTGKLSQESRMGKLQALLGELRIWADPPPSLLSRELETGFYIKLHGSIDWLYCPTIGCRNNQNLFAVEPSAFPEQREGNICRLCGAAIRSFIVPPVATKRLEDRGRLAFLWHLALRELVRTNCNMTLFGVSLAPNDFELRWLLRQAFEISGSMPRKVNLVNSNENHRKQTKWLFPKGHINIVEFESIEDFLNDKPC